MNALRGSSSKQWTTWLVLALAAGFVLAACGSTGQLEQGGRVVVRAERFIVAANTSQDYRAIWEEAPTGTQLRKSISVWQQADASVVRVRPQVSATASQTWLRAYQNSEAGVVTLIGHNENGVFRFSDGSTIDLSQLSSVSGPPLIVFSCDAARNVGGQVVGIVPDVVTLQVAAQIEQRVVAAVQERGVTDRAGLEALVDGVTGQVLAENSAYRVAGAVAVLSGGAIGVSVYTVVQ